ncbi:MAG: PD-(D/E)XK nuclease family protein [Gammaproteobacteria bacterium]
MAGRRLWHEEEILAALEAGAILVTASERLARAARLAHADAARARGVRVWERPEVLGWGAFLQLLFSRHEQLDLVAGPRLLAPHQAEVLWETVITGETANSPLLPPAVTARAAYAAWELCQAYDISLSELAHEVSSDDARQFSLWAHAYAEQCKTRTLLDVARLPDYLTQVFQAEKTVPPKHCLFIGFEEFTPQQQRLLACMRTAGSQVQELLVSGQRDNRCRRIVCADAQAEMQSAARWARALLEASPTLRIGIIVQDLSEQQQTLARTLNQILCPSLLPGALTPRPYNLSIGQALSACPIVSDALILLHCLHWRLPFETVSRLLRSPFIVAGEHELPARARLEVRLRDANLEQVGLQRLLTLAQQGGEAQAFQSALASMVQYLRGMPKRQLSSGWSKTFSSVLHTFGWYGERIPDSSEYQAVSKLRALLGEFAQLDAVLPPMDASEALTRFTRLVTQNEFQTASAEVPIQVLGMPETAGLQFDHVWIMGLTDDVWPASPRPDAFIPWTLQRRHALPHANAARELDYANRITARLLNSASEVVVSTPQRNADTELRPSPLLADIKEATSADLPQSQVRNWREQLQQEAAIALTEFTDEQAPPVLDGASVEGGTKVIKSQSICPFQAFAIYRLGAEELESPALGLSPRDRGLLLHAVMERLWVALKDHASLASLQPDARRQHIDTAITDALNPFAARNPDVFTTNFRRLEQERLTNLIATWLEIELARSPFSVEKPEQERRVKLGRLSLKTRVDRVDKLPDGGRVVIDYKSGMANPRDWLGERPDEPQLPIYAVSGEPAPAAVLFAQLRTGDLAFRGFAVQDGVAPGVGSYDTARKQADDPADWNALLDNWRTAVSALADEFMNGVARVAPKHGDETCRYCHLSTLCRIHERKAAGMEDDDAQD